MNQYSVRRLVRLMIGAFVVVIPIVAIATVQVSPSSASTEPGMPFQRSALLPYSQIVTQTQTAVAATQTYTASQTAAAGTQTAIPATQTAVSSNQTAIAATQTAAAQPSSTARFIDAYEPNNTIETAYTTSFGTALPGLTLWPIGDVDYFRFYAKANTMYEIFTRDLVGDLDTVLTAYNHEGNQLTTNDDYLDDGRDSLVEIFAGVDGYYYVKVENKAPTDPANKTFILEVREIELPTATATPTALAATDACDGPTQRNDTYQTACLILADEGSKAYDFVPAGPGLVDEDFFRMWVRAGYFYACETDDLSNLNDTIMVFFDPNGTPFASSDDKEPGDFGSLIEYYSTFTGWLTIQIRPEFAPEYNLSDRYTYEFGCTSLFATLTPTASATSTPFVGGPFPTRAATATFTPFPTLTPFAAPTSGLATPSTPTPRPNVQVNPLPTATPMTSGGEALVLNVTIYYDQNVNFTPEIDEGIVNIDVLLFHNGTGELLQYGTTNDAGIIRFGPLNVSGAVRLEVPFLSYSQVIVSSQPDIRVRVAPANLPDNIP